MLILDKADWYDSADVVVVGYGGGGAVAAAVAHDQGANVLILEKQPSDTHVTNTSMAGGIFISPADVKSTEEYLRNLARVDKELFWTDLETIKVWAEYTCQNRQWVEKMGGEIKRFPISGGGHREIPGNETIQHYYFEENGVGFMSFLKGLVSQRKIQVMHGVRAKRLIANHHGEVIGVAATGENGADMNIKAARAVILATGGFEFDEAMKLQFLRCYPIYFNGTPANTGDGVRMAMGMGAELWHMNCSAAGFSMKFPEMQVSFSPSMRGRDVGLVARYSGTESRPRCGYIIVDRTGRRFTNENYKVHHATYELAGYDSRALNFPRIPAYWIMDQRRLTDGPLSAIHNGSAGPANFYRWSENNKKELEKGWISCGETILELGRKLGIHAENLQKTVKNYNSYCRNNADLEFRRRPDSLVSLDTPPYYAVKLWPGGPNTQGGPRRNHKSQVMNVEGDPIPGLYATGELGSVFGMLYTGGGNLAECISFGRIAGENAAKEKPRSMT